jgi:hypothetical protein
MARQKPAGYRWIKCAVQEQTWRAVKVEAAKRGLGIEEFLRTIAGLIASDRLDLRAVDEPVVLKIEGMR